MFRHHNYSWKFSHILFQSIVLLFIWCTAGSAGETPKAALQVTDNQIIDLGSSRYHQLFQELQTRYHFEKEYLHNLFQDVRINRKVLILMDRQWEAKPYYRYKPLFVTPAAIEKGRRELKKYKSLFDKIEKQLGVDREVIVAIWGIESRFGSNMGGFSLFQTFNTLFDAYPRRSDFFRNELIQYLLLCRENNIDPLSINGSYAGAFGQAQFMPSSFNRYAIDFNADSKRDLISSEADIFASIGNYLKEFNWVLHAPIFAEIGTRLKADTLKDAYKRGRKGRVDWRTVAEIQDIKLVPPPDNGQLSIIGLKKSPLWGGGIRFVAGYPNLHAIAEYNHSNKYAMTVAEMAQAFKKQ
ncbi:MAG: lytic murein transglycosylase [Deltaproteobacteria bacterium]|nr:lytic murein transglycosylase [Deltaproteobacteria bacterium]MBW2658271.1 lytic murein transglycosylase [Deltaproteobacteria bacterium]